MYEKLYFKIVNSLVKDGFIVVKNAISEKLSSELLSLSKQDCDFKRAGISSSSDLHLDDSRRRDKICWLDEDGSTQSEFLEFMRGLMEFANRELYLGLSYYESHFAIYDEGDFYETHLDAFKNSKNRVVTTVFYLNEEWSDEDGGELVVYDEQNNFLKKVTPDANTLVVFLSDKFPHEVLPANRKRYSIAGWFRVDR